MRINLVTPFAEKDAAKALGARWDGTRKVWYITDVEDLTPFAKWIPDLAAARATPAPAPSKLSAPGVRTGPALAPAHCGCQVLPWVACEHSAAVQVISAKA